MTKLIRIKYNEKEYDAGFKCICDVCTKTIFDSRNQKEANYYVGHNSDLCSKGCVRKTFDHYLNSKLSEGDEFCVTKSKITTVYDYNNNIPEGIPEDEYKKLQREAR